MTARSQFLLVALALFAALHPAAARENAGYFTNITVVAGKIGLEVVTPAPLDDWMIEGADSLTGPWNVVFWEAGPESNRVVLPVDRPEGYFRATAMLMLAPLAFPGGAQSAENLVRAGVAKIDVTPEYPIRLSGYGARGADSEGIEQRLWAKALAFGEAQDTSLLLTVDNAGVPARVTEAVYARVAARTELPRENFAIASSHTHSGPMLTGNLSNLFSQDIPPDQQATIDRYTQELIGHLQKVALDALADRRPSKLSWGEGSATFGHNRRTPGGPVDHAMPMLAVHSPTGALRAVLAKYACHCTTLGGDFNKHHGDWAGAAQEFIEREHPGAVALIAIGCGGDINPRPRGSLALARQHGQEIASEAARLLKTDLKPLKETPSGRIKRIGLPFDTLPTRSEWEARAGQPGIAGYHARKNLDRLDRGETLPTHLPYLVQTWTFGPDLAMVFLPGEVVVDFSLRLKTEFDSRRLWVNAYSNDVPCYIPSKRILKEGGYEAETAMLYYDQPARLAMETEDLIINTVHELLPAEFRARNAASD